MYQFLRCVGLRPLTWEQAVRLTGSSAPDTLTVIKAGMRKSAAIVVLMTPDEFVTLRPDLTAGAPDKGHQPRPNVLIEAGMALAAANRRTILVRMGPVREISDIKGINYVGVADDAQSRQRFLMRLQTAGCEVETNEDYLDPKTGGNFEVALTFDEASATDQVQESPPQPKRTLPSDISVVSEGILWMWTGDFYLGTDQAIPEAHCPKHKVKLLFRDNRAGSIRALRYEDRIRDGLDNGQLYCPSAATHTLKFTESRTVEEAELRAASLLTLQVRRAGRSRR